MNSENPTQSDQLFEESKNTIPPREQQEEGSQLESASGAHEHGMKYMGESSEDEMISIF